jgi:tRNA A37 threonylcarbamoyladenosine dehydratase
MAHKHDRIKILLQDDFAKLRDAKVLLLGVGGVGSFCLDCLYRSGVEQITIVDFDSYDASNQNRQMWSELHEGELKVSALKEHYPAISIINARIDEQWVEGFDFEPYDLVLDAIDDTKAKLALAQKCYKKLIASFGSAKRVDPTQVKVADIWKSYGDKFGSKIRYELRKRGFKKKYKVIFSSEAAQVKQKGSFMGVTATFGLVMCAEAIKELRKKQGSDGV